MTTREEPIRLLVVDDHPVVRDGLAALIARRDDMRLVAEAADGRQAVERFREHRPDVTLMDLGLPRMDGVAAIHAIRRKSPDARILVLSMRHGDEDVHEALRAGARGYLLKDSTWQDIADAIVAVAQGLKRVSTAAATVLAERVGAPSLTQRERQVLDAMARGKCNRDIGDELGITEATVKAHVTGILGKLGVSDRTQAVMSAVRRGVIHLG